MQNLLDTYFHLNSFSWGDVTLRLLLAGIFGLFLGLDRDQKDKPVDFRVYMIVAMSTVVIAIMGQELNSHYNSSEEFLSLDLGKIIAGVMTGIGFLGAGAIIKVNNQEVVGTATGASIWACGGMGLCLGFGLYGLAILLFVALATTLMIAGRIMAKLSNIDQK